MTAELAIGSSTASATAVTDNDRKKLRILLTGFGPFNGVVENPTTYLIQELTDEIANCTAGLSDSHIQTKLLDVSCDGVDSAICRDTTTNTDSNSYYDLYIHLGVNSSATSICLEQSAYNCKDFRCADNKGYQPQQQSICDACRYDENLNTFINIDDAIVKLNELGYNGLVSVSTDPGRFLCNYVYYQSLQHQKLKCKPMLSLFVHVPQFTVIDKSKQLECIKSLLRILEQEALTYL